MTGTLVIWLILLCMLGEAFFAGMEIGVVSIHKMRLRHFLREGSDRAKHLQYLLDHPEKLLGTTLVGTNLCVVTSSVLAAGLATRWLGAWGETVSSAIMAILLLVFCEYLPKAWFQSRPFERAGRFVYVLETTGRVLHPISAAATWVTNWMIPGRDEDNLRPLPFITREELKHLTREQETHGILSPDERVMIHRVFELAAKPAHRIMTPRDAMVTLPASATIDALRRTARETGFLRFPILNAETGQFDGIVNLYDTLSDPTLPDDQPLTPFMRKPLFIRHDLPITRILPRQRMARQPLALVTDPSQNVIGMITTADILEEIVGTY